MPDPGLLSDEEEERARRWQAGAGGLLSIGAGLMGYGADIRNPAPLMAGIAGFQDALRGAVADRQAAERARYMRAQAARLERKDAAEEKTAQAMADWSESLAKGGGNLPFTPAETQAINSLPPGQPRLELAQRIITQRATAKPDEKSAALERLAGGDQRLRDELVAGTRKAIVGPDGQTHVLDTITGKPIGSTIGPKPNDPLVRLETDIRGTAAALNRFEDVIKENKGGSLDVYMNNPQSPKAQKVLAAYQAMVMALRSESFMNTGVLQPAEMELLENNLLAPDSIRGAFSSPEAYKAKLDEYRRFMDGKLQGAYQARGQKMPEGLTFMREQGEAPAIEYEYRINPKTGLQERRPKR